MDQLLVNLRLLGWIENDLTSLSEYCEKTSAGTGEIEYLPDGSYLVDGKPATDEAAVAKLLGDAAWFRVTSRYSLGLVAARLGRLEEDASRAPSCQNGLTYRLASGSPEQISRRSFGLVNALVTAVE